MQKTLFWLILSITISAPSASAAYQLVWSDEFDGTTLNTANWSYQNGDGCPGLCGWGNNELQYYRSQNTTVSGGNLIITAKEESYSGSSYTSGKIISINKQDFLYGTMQARIQVPTGGGMWPAFWMMPTYSVYGGWAASGEIDIMETKNQTDYIGGAIHYGGSWPDNTYSSQSYSPGGVDFSDAFHVYSIEWEPTAIRWYVDGILYFTKTNWWTGSQSDNGTFPAPFNEDFYFILNVAVGGNYTGCTDPGCITASFPQQMLIDWVRVYQETANIAPTVSITDPSEGANLPAGTIAIDVTASDADGSVATVEFYEGANYLGQDTTSPYTFNWLSVTDGCYTITAKAIDDVGGSTTDTISITVASGCGQGPFYGSPSAIPGLIQAEDFDTGGQDVAYHDTDIGNNGSQYRTTEDVDIEVCSEGGYNVGWMASAEWIEYTVDIDHTGPYTIQARVASNTTGGTFHINLDGADVTGNIIVPVTGGWQNWTTVTDSAVLTAGTHIIRFQNASSTDEYNINYFNFIALPVLQADIIYDNVIDELDLIALAIDWKKTSPSPADIAPAGGDGKVDTKDFNALSKQWRMTIP